MRKVISTIIVNYNSASLAVRAVKSVYNTPAHGFTNDIIVIDNTATDSEREKLVSSLQGFARVILNERNIGFGNACNIALKEAEGDYILLLNPDAFLVGNALTTLVEFLQKNKRAGAVGPTAYLDNDMEFYLFSSPYVSPVMPVIELMSRIFPTLRTFRSLRHRRNTLREIKSRMPVKKKNLCGGHVLLKKEVIEKIGGLFDPRFFLYYEDTDLFLRIQRANYNLYVHQDARVIHNYNQCMPLDGVNKQQHMVTAHRQYIEKYDNYGLIRAAIKILLRYVTNSPVFNKNIKNMGALINPPEFDVPVSIQSEWVFEFSPNEDFIPSAMKIGKGAIAQINSETWTLLKSGRYYARIGRVTEFGSKRKWMWDIK